MSQKNEIHILKKSDVRQNMALSFFDHITKELIDSTFQQTPEHNFLLNVRNNDALRK
jgi:hypothetical protein